MPSYRVIVDILAARPGVAPERVLPGASELLARSRRVEDRKLLVNRGQPQVQLRFFVEASNDAAEDREALAVAAEFVKRLDESVARCGPWALRRRNGRVPGGWPLVGAGREPDPGW